MLYLAICEVAALCSSLVRSYYSKNRIIFIGDPKCRELEAKHIFHNTTKVLREK